MDLAVNRFEVYLVNLEPTVGSEMLKVRPCVVLSAEELNRTVRTTIVAPLTTGGRAYATRVACRFAGRDGYVALDQLRSLDQSRLIRRLGRLAEDEGNAALAVLAAMFAP